MLKTKFEKAISFLRSKKIVITTHDLVDIDGLISCYAFKNFINLLLKTHQTVICFSEISKHTKSFMKKITLNYPNVDFVFETKIDFLEFDVCLVLDTNNLDQIKYKKELQESEIFIIFIDHHYSPEKDFNRNFSSMNLIIEQYSSTAEIILELHNAFNIEISTSLKILMIAAILTDSGFFKHGDNNTIRNVSKLLNDEINFQDILRLLDYEIDVSEKIAKIKGLQRVQLIREGDYLIGITNVSSYGATISSMLMKVGFDISFVYSEEKNGSRINARAKRSVCLKTGLHLGKILGEIANEFRGSGGGHDGAASINSEIEASIIIDKIIKKVKSYLQLKL